MRKAFLLLVGLTLAASQTAVAQVGADAPFIVRAHNVTQSDDTLIVSGGAVIRISGYEIRADRAEIIKLAK
jgi:lipopolysaccharide assembly outer membrane protein LptD (OstA)